MTLVSISVAAGEVCHNMHCAAIVDVMISANIDGGLAFAGQYAKKRGCCQCVIPGITMRSKSDMISDMSVPVSGALCSNCCAISPGFVCARTGRLRSVL